mgnify:FL=1
MLLHELGYVAAISFQSYKRPTKQLMQATHVEMHVRASAGHCLRVHSGHCSVVCLDSWGQKLALDLHYIRILESIFHHNEAPEQLLADCANDVVFCRIEPSLYIHSSPLSSPLLISLLSSYSLISLLSSPSLISLLSSPLLISLLSLFLTHFSLPFPSPFLSPSLRLLS